MQKLLRLIVFIGTLFLAQCGSDDESTTPTTTTPTASTYAQVDTYFKTACISCHIEGGTAASTWLVSDYAGIKARSNTTTPKESALLTKGTNTVTHSGGSIFTVDDDNYKMILSWITAGALEK